MNNILIELDNEKLRRLQMIELDMLCEVDRICRSRNINYTIIGGTLLGAVRHGGFIPWDDDADVAMLRPDYQKFLKACDEELDNSKYYFQYYGNTVGYRWGYGKLRRKGTLFIREGQEHMPYGQEIFLDIFPVDSVPDQAAARSLQKLICFCMRKILWSEVGRVSEKNKGKRVIYKILSQIPEKYVFQMYEKMFQRGMRKETGLVRTLTFPLPHNGKGYQRRWFSDTKDILFEGRMLRGIMDYDAWLSYEFGDYMKIPGQEHRKMHPVSCIKLI